MLPVRFSPANVSCALLFFYKPYYLKCRANGIGRGTKTLTRNFVKSISPNYVVPWYGFIFRTQLDIRFVATCREVVDISRSTILFHAVKISFEAGYTGDAHFRYNEAICFNSFFAYKQIK